MNPEQTLAELKKLKPLPAGKAIVYQLGRTMKDATGKDVPLWTEERRPILEAVARVLGSLTIRVNSADESLQMAVDIAKATGCTINIGWTPWGDKQSPWASAGLPLQPRVIGYDDVLKRHIGYWALQLQRLHKAGVRPAYCVWEHTHGRPETVGWNTGQSDEIDQLIADKYEATWRLLRGWWADVDSIYYGHPFQPLYPKQYHVDFLAHRSYKSSTANDTPAQMLKAVNRLRVEYSSAPNIAWFHDLNIGGDQSKYGKTFASGAWSAVNTFVFARGQSAVSLMSNEWCEGLVRWVKAYNGESK